MSTRISAVLFGSAFAGMALLALLDAAAKAFVLLALAAVLTLVLRRASAAARHIVWISALACALVLPCGAWLLPQWRVLPSWMAWEEIPKRLSVAAPIEPALPAANSTVPLPMPDVPQPSMDEPLVDLLPDVSSTIDQQVPASPIRLNARALLLFWSGGAMLLLMPLFYSFSRLRRLSRQARPVSEGALVELMHELQREIGVRQKVRLLVGAEDTMPMVWGVLRPCLLLPAGASTWAPSRLRAVLLHELAHLRRRDPLSILIAQLALAVHWFNPLAWLAVRQLRAEQERACDDYVLRYGVRASDYASDLLTVATSLRGVPLSTTALAMAYPARLEGRIAGILDAARNRRALTRWVVIAAALCASVIALPLAMLGAAEERKPEPAQALVDTLRQVQQPDLADLTGVTTTANSAEITVEAEQGGLVFVVGEDKKLIVHQFASSEAPISFRVDADDRRGKWWDQVRVLREGESTALTPVLPETWLPTGRLTFMKEPVTKADGSRMIAEIESAHGKVPLAVRAAKASEIERAQLREIPQTCPETEINVATRIHALEKDAPKSLVILPVMAAQDLIGAPKTALALPSQTVRPGFTQTFDRFRGLGDLVKVTPTLTRSGVKVEGRIAITFPEGEYNDASEAWKRIEVALSNRQNSPPRTKTVATKFLVTLGGNDAMVVPIHSDGLFPDTLVASMTALPRQVTRTQWRPPEDRSPIQVDGWVLSWPRAEHQWFTSMFDYKGLPEMISHHLELRKKPTENSVRSEAVGTLDQPEVEKLLQGFRAAAHASVVRVEPFEVHPNRSAFLQVRARFIADGEGASLSMSVHERTISPYLSWDKPVLKHISAPSAYGVYSGSSLCVLLPGPADPENIRMLVLRCVDPDQQRVQPPRAEKNEKATPALEPVKEPHAVKGKTRGRIIDRNGFVLAESANAKSRRYPFLALASHTLGFTGSNQDGQLEGRSGLEEAFDAPLRKGEDVQLTLDARMQSAVEKVLRDADVGRGAVVILNPVSGEVLANVSVPNFDPNAFVPAISMEKWKALNDNPAHPLMNRSGQAYTPGQIYTLAVALAAGRGGKADRVYTCKGIVTYGNKVMQCWTNVAHPESGGHGELNLAQAIKESCNVYFYQLGNEIGIETIAETAHLLGLGKRTGLAGLTGESPGIVSSPAWLKSIRPDEKWTAGYTANAAIGQGSTLATPIQLAGVAATIANGGLVLTPQILRGAAPQVSRDMMIEGCKPEHLELIRNSMSDIVQNGGGRKAHTDLISIAGKTASSQFWRSEGGKRVPEVAAWFVGYAPAEAPRFAFTVLVQGGKSGGASAAPLARRIMEAVGGDLPAPEPQPTVEGHVRRFELLNDTKE